MPNLAQYQPARAERQKGARASEYRRSLPHSEMFGANVGNDLANSGITHCLIAIAEVDSCTAGALLAELADLYARQLANTMAAGDNGNLIKTPEQKPLEHYIQRVQQAIHKLKGC